MTTASTRLWLTLIGLWTANMAVHGQEFLPLTRSEPTFHASQPPPVEPGMEFTNPAQMETSDEENGRTWRVGVDYLYLRARRQYMSYALVDPLNNGVPNGYLESVDWPACSGLRATIARTFHPSHWDLAFTYTYFHSVGNSQVAAPPGGVLYATLSQPGTVEQVATARADSSINYHVYDLEAGRSWRPNEYLTLRPSGGLRFAHIDQNLNAYYNGIDANNDMVASNLTFDGVGLRMAGDGHWNFGGCGCRAWQRGWSLVGRAAGSLLVGDFQGCWHEISNDAPGTFVQVADRFTRVVPVLELGLGISWQYRNLQLSAGYEVINWFNLLDAPQFVDDVHQGKIVRQTSDVSLDGLVLRAQLGF